MFKIGYILTPTGNTTISYYITNIIGNLIYLKSNKNIKFSCSYGFAQQLINSGCYEIINNTITNTNSSGAICISCKQYNSYAAYINDFKCWACKNGA